MEKIKSMFKKMNDTNKLSSILLIILGLSIIPIVLIAFYSFPAFDDFNHSVETFKVIKNGGSFLELLKAAIDWTKNVYISWQGTYTAIFLSAFQPGVFGVEYYFLAPIILIGSLVFANYYSSNVVFKTFLKNNSSSWIIIATIVSFLQIQTLPSAQEGFFWWAGGIMHTFFFSLLLVQVALTMKLLSNEKKSIIRAILLVIIVILSGGGSYETALASFTIFLTILFFCLMYDRKNKGNIYLLIFNSLIALIFLLINVLAPGNAVRATQSGVHVSAVVAILESFIYAGVHVFEYVSLGTITLTLIIFYYIYPIIKKNNLKKINPLLFGSISFCTYATFFTPTIYGENYVASLRYLNVLYFAFYWLLISNIIVFLNYYKTSLIIERFYNIIFDVLDGKVIKQSLIIIFLLCSSILNFSYLDATSSSATVDLILGNAQNFKSVNEMRMELLLNEDLKRVEIPQYKNNVRIFYIDYLTDKPNKGMNKIYEKYFEKEEVIAEENYDD